MAFLTRAEIPFPAPVSAAEKLDWIVEVMQTQRFQRGKSAELIAEVWQMAPATIKGYTTEARRVIATGIDPSAIREDLTVGLLEMWRHCVQTKDVKNGPKVAETLSKICGATSADSWATTQLKGPGAQVAQSVALRLRAANPLKLVSNGIAENDTTAAESGVGESGDPEGISGRPSGE